MVTTVFVPGQSITLYSSAYDPVCQGTLFINKVLSEPVQGRLRKLVTYSKVALAVALAGFILGYSALKLNLGGQSFKQTSMSSQETTISQLERPTLPLPAPIPPSPPTKTLVQKQGDETQKIRSYFTAKGSILSDYAENFTTVAQDYNLDPYLLPAVTMAESSGCKRYIRHTNNCFGWGHGKIQFISHEEAIRKIGYTVGTQPLYKHYQRNGRTVTAFAQNYNNPYWSDYAKKITYFMSEIKNYQL